MIADDVGSLLVMDDTDIVGIVTERDVLRAVAEGKTQGIVKAIMTPEPDLLESDVAVTEAAEWMMAAGYRHLPVVKQGQLIGMVSIKDLVWALTEQIRDGGNDRHRHRHPGRRSDPGRGGRRPPAREGRAAPC